MLNRIKKIIKEIFHYPEISHEIVNYDSYWEARNNKENKLINSFQKERSDWILPKIDANAKILDIGCGDGGILLYIKQKKNIIPIGAEISNYAIEHLIRKGIKAIKFDINNFNHIRKIPNVDYIILFEVLEHIQNPEELLKLLNEKVLKSIFISIPNTGYFTHRFRMLFGRFPLQWVVHPGEHVRFWTYKDIKWWLNELGYKERSKVHIYQGVPFLNKIWGSLFGKGIVIEISKHQ